MSNSVLEDISREGVRKYGEICNNPDCGMHEAFCRCKGWREKYYSNSTHNVDYKFEIKQENETKWFSKFVYWFKKML